MVKKLIQQFKNFLIQEGASTPFQGFYRDYHFEDNPDNFEEYLEKTEAPFVIVNAFDFNRILLNKTFNKKYWYRLHAMWNRILVLNTKNLDRISNEAGVTNNDIKTENKDSWFDKLVKVSKPTSSSTNNMADDEIRFTTNHYYLVFNSKLSALADSINARMSVKADSQSGEMILVFSPKEDLNVRRYTDDKKCVSRKPLKTYIEKYLDINLEDDCDIILYTKPPRWNKDNTAFAVTVKKEYKTL